MNLIRLLPLIALLVQLAVPQVQLFNQDQGPPALDQIDDSLDYGDELLNTGFENINDLMNNEGLAQGTLLHDSLPQGTSTSPDDQNFDHDQTRLHDPVLTEILKHNEKIRAEINTTNAAYTPTWELIRTFDPIELGIAAVSFCLAWCLLYEPVALVNTFTLVSNEDPRSAEPEEPPALAVDPKTLHWIRRGSYHFKLFTEALIKKVWMRMMAMTSSKLFKSSIAVYVAVNGLLEIAASLFGYDIESTKPTNIAFVTSLVIVRPCLTILGIFNLLKTVVRFAKGRRGRLVFNNMPSMTDSLVLVMSLVVPLVFVFHIGPTMLRVYAKTLYYTFQPTGGISPASTTFETAVVRQEAQGLWRYYGSQYLGSIALWNPFLLTMSIGLNNFIQPEPSLRFIIWCYLTVERWHVENYSLALGYYDLGESEVSLRQQRQFRHLASISCFVGTEVMYKMAVLLAQHPERRSPDNEDQGDDQESLRGAPGPDTATFRLDENGLPSDALAEGVQALSATGHLEGGENIPEDPQLGDGGSEGKKDLDRNSAQLKPGSTSALKNFLWRPFVRLLSLLIGPRPPDKGSSAEDHLEGSEKPAEVTSTGALPLASTAHALQESPQNANPFWKQRHALTYDLEFRNHQSFTPASINHSPTKRRASHQLDDTGVLCDATKENNPCEGL